MVKYKIVSIGDLHGRTIWKDIVSKEEDVDKIIIMGDYFDTHENVSARQQIDNFKDILEYKKANLDKVVLLIGNHDFHYMKGIGETYSGYQAVHAIDISELIHSALDENLIQMCYVSDKYVFTHAGVTKAWVAQNEIDVTNLEQSINDRFKYKPNSFKFTIGKNYSMYGDDCTQTPIWVRPKALHSDMIDDVICVVGHTNQYSIIIRDNVIFIDTLGTSQEYLRIIDGVPSIVK